MKIKTQELRQKTTDELSLLLKENQAKLQRLRFDLASKKLKNTGELSQVKKMIAKILTISQEIKNHAQETN
ncbi:MAG: 50S ribosomal protein L29 [Candidatus Portnoybacteria bacterium]|jgi:ribosomal protein L29|nr:50S ribosomal protein L29 [Candidatus Portnoybacteria bacterium]